MPGGAMNNPNSNEMCQRLKKFANDEGDEHHDIHALIADTLLEHCVRMANLFQRATWDVNAEDVALVGVMVTLWDKLTVFLLDQHYERDDLFGRPLRNMLLEYGHLKKKD
jgi:hypothetical protein